MATRPRRLLTVLVSAGLVLAPATLARAGSNDLQFADGKWQGTIVYSADATFPAGPVNAQATLESASFEADVTGGTMTGTFSAQGSSTSQTLNGSAMLSLAIDGTMTGTAGAPVIDPQSGQLTGSATVGTFTVPINLSFGSSLTDVPLTITGATCSQVNGNFIQPVAAAVAGGGSIVNFTATFFAVRTGQSSGALEALQQLMAVAQKISDNFAQTGQLDAAGLIEVVAHAEAFSASLAKAASCGASKGADQFSLAITGIVAHMLDLAVTDPTALSTTQLTDLLWIGTQVGVVGQGALDQDLSDEILKNAKSIVAGRLSDAIAAQDKLGIHEVLVAAVTMGWGDLEQKADAAYKALP